MIHKFRQVCALFLMFVFCVSVSFWESKQQMLSWYVLYVFLTVSGALGLHLAREVQMHFGDMF